VILADTSVWVDHLRAADAALSGLLDEGQILCHPFIVGEIALGHLKHRRAMIGLLQNLPFIQTAADAEVLLLVENRSLAGEGIGYVDAHLLAAVQLTPGTALWTRDKRLAALAERLHLGASL
jgi:predicted nucleic acid-binding protein